MTTKMRGRLVPSDRQQPKMSIAGDTKTTIQELQEKFQIKKIIKIKQKKNLITF